MMDRDVCVCVHAHMQIYVILILKWPYLIGPVVYHPYLTDEITATRD